MAAPWPAPAWTAPCGYGTRQPGSPPLPCSDIPSSSARRRSAPTGTRWPPPAGTGPCGCGPWANRPDDAIAPIDSGKEPRTPAGWRGAVAARRRRLHLGLSVPVHVLERRDPGAAGCSGLAAHVRQPHLGVEVSQVRGHVGIAERVDDGDRHTLALISLRVQRR